MGNKKEKEEKIFFSVESPEILQSLLASSTWRPGKARPPASFVRAAWLKSKDNAWVRSMITMAAGIGFGYIFSLNPTIANLIFAIGTGVVAAAVVLLIFFIAFLCTEYVKVGRT